MTEAVKAVQSPRDRYISAPDSVVKPKREIYRHRTIVPASGTDIPGAVDVLKNKVDVLIRKRS